MVISDSSGQAGLRGAQPLACSWRMVLCTIVRSIPHGGAQQRKRGDLDTCMCLAGPPQASALPLQFRLLAIEAVLNESDGGVVRRRWLVAASKQGESRYR